MISTLSTINHFSLSHFSQCNRKSNQAEPHERWIIDEDETCWWVLAGCTCVESWYIAKLTHPLLDCITMTQRFGIQNCVIIWPWSDQAIRYWLVKEQNRWQSGSGYNIQHVFDDVQKMWSSWKTHCATNNFTDSSWGTGASSHDQMCWSFLNEKFKKDSRY